jgi:uncharacterized phiE125 gp8 family phage protein
MAGIKLITDALVEPIALSDAKNYLRIDSSDTTDDALVMSLIRAARKHCEQYTRLAFISQTWEYWLDHFPTGKRHAGDPWWDGSRQGSIIEIFGQSTQIHVPKSPLLSVVSLTTYDTTDTGNAFDTSQLVLDTASLPGRVFLKFGQVWPVNLRALNAVCLRFTAGYSTDASMVPQDIIQACLIMLAHFYENREPVLEGRALETPLSVRPLLDPYRVNRV